MKSFKISAILVVCLLFFVIDSKCLASDLYIGEQGDYKVYLRTESICYDFYVTPGSKEMRMESRYQTICIPNPEELDRLRNLCMDNTISYRINTYNVTLHGDRLERKWEEGAPFLYLTSGNIYNTDNKAVFYAKQSGLGFICRLNSDKPEDEIYKDTYEQVVNYMKEHKEIVHSHVQ